MVEIRPDIILTTSITYCFVKNLGHQYTKVMETIPQYLKGLKERGITYDSQIELLIEGYSDSNWVGDKKS